MRILLIGKNGQVGWELERLFPKLGEVIALGRQELDVSDLKILKECLLNIKPDLIVNASAYTEVDRAEKENDKAMRINAEAPGVMAETAHKINAAFIHYSTDYVFDGTLSRPYTENDSPHPLNMYGKSKLAGEKNIEQVRGAYIILRTSWVYSMRGNTFVHKILARARSNETLLVVDDQISNPTWSRALVETTVRLVDAHRGHLQDVMKEKRGVYHAAGNGYTSRYEWAKQILANASHRTDILAHTIQPVSTDAFPLPATRPLFSALDCSKLEDTFQVHLPDWRGSLNKAMME
jgi:dTDP-4-dehydrorhamnose reductase